MTTNPRLKQHPLNALRLALCLAIGTLAVGQAAHAATAAGTMSVTATVASSCVVGTSSLAFGSVTSAAIQAGNVDAAGSVTVNCTTGSTYTVGLGVGAGAAATAALRKMTSVTPAATLNYSIYTTAGRTIVWDTTTGTVPGTGTGIDQSIPAYGRIFSGQTVPASAGYVDTVAVTVTY